MVLFAAVRRHTKKLEMNKILTLTIILGFFTFKGLTQTYFPFPDSTAIWNTEKTNCFYTWNIGIKYGQIGDTIINQLSYKKLYSIVDTTLTNPQSTYFCGIREENKRVYVKFNSMEEQLLYDFNLTLGDSIVYYYSCINAPNFQPDTFSRKVVTIDFLEMEDGTFRRHYVLEKPQGFSFMNDEWIEGVGSIVWYGLFNPFVYDGYTNGDNYQAACLKVNDSLVFLGNTTCGSCFCEIYSQIIDISTKNEIILPYPNPTTDNILFKYPDLNNSNKSLRIVDLKGNLLIEKQEIETNELILKVDWLKRGIYVYEMIVDGKVINYGKIVKK